MVAVVVGNDLGLVSGSLGVLGSAGLNGSATQGRSGESVYVNAATDIYRATGDITQAQMPIRFNSVVGSGYQRGSLDYGVQYSGQVYLNSSGKAVSAFPVWGQ